MSQVNAAASVSTPAITTTQYWTCIYNHVDWAIPATSDRGVAEMEAQQLAALDGRVVEVRMDAQGQWEEVPEVYPYTSIV
jgi:hypothetical protein